ncbi:MAG: hypothetical protein Q7S40_28510 [Opitutaceae bacterium]|nr:hypothetical protein [Opitutaceae bacterium]
MFGKRLLLLLLPALAIEGVAWHTEPHQRITFAAIDSLPPTMQERLGSEMESLVKVYCMYPDRYRELSRPGPDLKHNPGPDDRSVMRIYCETPRGKLIHNVTWNRQEDLEAITYLLNSIIAEVRRDNPAGAACYMGTLAHLFEDSTSPAHATDLSLIQELLPPPKAPAYVSRVDAAGHKIGLHAAIELTTAAFRLDGTPKPAGGNVSDAATELLKRCYAIIRDNRAHLLEMVRATYADDRPVMERLRSRAAKQGAQLLADAYYTALLLADD